MYAVAIYAVDGDPSRNVEILCEALGITAYEARSRVQMRGGGPAVVATSAARAPCDALALRLRAAGLNTIVREDSSSAEVSEFGVRTFSLGEQTLTVARREGEAHTIEWGQIDIVFRGVAVMTSTTTKNVQVKKFSVGLAVATGGLMMRKKTNVKQVKTSTSSEGFIVVYSKTAPPVLMSELSLDYTSLGANMGPARAANFMYLVNAIRTRATAAAYDDRLMRRGLQQQLLGPSLNADDYLNLAVALAAQAHRAQTA